MIYLKIIPTTAKSNRPTTISKHSKKGLNHPQPLYCKQQSAELSSRESVTKAKAQHSILMP
jgi:hypothetical protein